MWSLEAGREEERRIRGREGEEGRKGWGGGGGGGIKFIKNFFGLVA